MPLLSFKKSFSPIQVEAGAKLMEALLKEGRPVASSCNGDGVCAKCRIEILEGAENLSPIEEREKFLIEKNKIPKNFRISCQTKVQGDIKIDAPYW